VRPFGCPAASNNATTRPECALVDSISAASNPSTSFLLLMPSRKGDASARRRGRVPGTQGLAGFLAGFWRPRCGRPGASHTIRFVARYDLLLRGGRVIDPGRGVDGALDVAVGDGRIVAVGPALPESAATEVVDVRGRLVLPGLVDTHPHVYQYVTGRFGLEADLVGIRSGVSTLVDQGGASCMTLPGFRAFVVRSAASRVYAFLSAYLVGGLEGHYYPALYRPDCIDVGATVKAARENRDLVRGLKAHAE